MLLETRRLRKEYVRAKVKKSFCALDNVNLSLNRGESVSIIGRSGSGKSTLLNIIAGLLTPTSGGVVFNGTNLYELGDDELSRLRNSSISYLPQGTSLISSLNAIENICLPYYLGGHKDDCYASACKLLEEVGLGQMEESYPAEMSGGEMLRVAIARALMNSPELIIADEPTSDLDVETAHEIMELLAGFNKRGTALLIVTHDLEMTRYSENIYKIESGRLQNFSGQGVFVRTAP